jgi:hypothetical protein
MTFPLGGVSCDDNGPSNKWKDKYSMNEDFSENKIPKACLLKLAT